MADPTPADLVRELMQQTPEDQLLERMRLHGFWPAHKPRPQDPPQEAAERAKVQAEIQQLRKTGLAVANAQQALAQERKRRWEESKKRRAERKALRAQEEQQRREAYQQFRQ